MTSSSERFDCDVGGLGCRLDVSNGMELGSYTTAAWSSATKVTTTAITNSIAAGGGRTAIAVGNVVVAHTPTSTPLD